MWIDDDVLIKCQDPLAMSIWVPQDRLVVLGSSNQPESEVDTSACLKDGIPIFKRYGGGGTVLLHEGCVVVSLGLWVQQLYQNKLYFHRLNHSIISSLSERWPKLGRLEQKGLSDITHGDQKVGGTSLFRSRNYLLYQASILVDAKPHLIAQYLKHPTREPDYRSGRAHKDFLIGLSALEEDLTVVKCADQLRVSLASSVQTCLGDELLEPQPDQFAALAARIARSQSQSGRPMDI